LQIFVEDFVQEDFIDACVGINVARYSLSLLAAAPATVGSATLFSFL
jgi:hypothetical protein